MAQDVIVKKDGTTIMSKVLEIGDSEIKYKKYSNQNGPTYTIKKVEIFSINYENGEKERFEDSNTTAPQTLPHTETINSFSTANDKIAAGIETGNRLQREKLLASAKSWGTASKVIFWVGAIGGIGGALLSGASASEDSTFWIIMGCGLGAGLIGGGICGSIANNKMEAANSIQASHIIKQDFNLGNANLTAGVDVFNDRQAKEKALGIGLAYSF